MAANSPLREAALESPSELARFKHNDTLAMLANLIDEIDLNRFIRLTWLLDPFIRSRTLRSRVFHFGASVTPSLIS